MKDQQLSQAKEELEKWKVRLLLHHIFIQSMLQI